MELVECAAPEDPARLEPAPLTALVEVDDDAPASEWVGFWSGDGGETYLVRHRARDGAESWYRIEPTPVQPVIDGPNAALAQAYAAVSSSGTRAADASSGRRVPMRLMARDGGRTQLVWVRRRSA
jgi:hypothetical protein